MAREVLLITGSLRSGSFTSTVLRRAASFVPDALEATEFDAIRPLPYYDADLDADHASAPEAVREARARVAAAAGVVIATPEYNGTVPGGLKNATDWLTRPFRAHAFIGKPVLVLGTSPLPTGAGGAVDWLRSTLAYLGADVVGAPITIGDVAERLSRTPVDASIDDELVRGVAALSLSIEAAAARR